MRIGGRRQSNNIEDRRGAGIGRKGGLGIGAILLAVAASYFLGIDPRTALQVASQLDGGAATQPAAGPVTESDREAAARELVSVVLADTEDTWHSLLDSPRGQYREPTLVLFRGSTPTACGTGQAAMGPFYCGADEKIYIDLGFYDQLQQRFGAPGDFAQAYVIAHEVGHHVQNLMGISDRMREQQRGLDEARANALSVKLELQADCLAGVWANHANRSAGLVEAGDFEEAIRAASAIGDDTLQKNAQGYAVPDSFTHGTSEQRVRWFRAGFEAGGIQACNTFAAQAP